MNARLWLLLFATGFFGATLTAQNAPGRPPDIVLFLADDLSWADLSANGAPDIKTPHMDRLRADGLEFSQAFVASPSCAPSRGALLTGLYPVRNGAMNNHQPPAADVKRWPAYFQDLGYEVVAIGKVAHYAQITEYGFDHCSHYGYHDDACVDEAIKWLEARRDARPLCLMVGTNWPHVPWPVKGELNPADVTLAATMVDTPETRVAWTRYAAAVGNADRDVGKFYDAFRRLLPEGSLFVFSSDHGSQFPFGKWNGYDAGVRTPLYAVWPGRIQPGTTTDALVSWIDIMPTLIEVAGGTPPAEGTAAGQVSGRSFLPVMREPDRPHRDRVFFTHSGDGKRNEYPLRAVRSHRWKYIRNLAPDREYHSNVENKKGEGYFASWVKAAEADESARRLVQRYFKRPAEELYDVTADPAELHNLAGQPVHAETLRALRVELDVHMAANGDLGLPTEVAMRLPPRKGEAQD